MNAGPHQARYECDDCGKRFPARPLPDCCEFCSGRTLTELDPVPDDSVRIYCLWCDFESVIHKDDAVHPFAYAEGRAKLHSSKGGHMVRWESEFSFQEESSDDGMRSCGRLESEEELQEWLEEQFEKHGWTAIREVSPHSSSDRADLIVNHDRYGWMGIETKYFKRDGGAKIAEAHHQITKKYRGKKYIGNRINLWVFCPYFYGLNADDPFQINQQWMRARLSKEFFSKHGIGFIDLDRSDLLIDFGHSMPVEKIPVDGDEGGRYRNPVDMGEIREGVEEKMDKYEY